MSKVRVESTVSINTGQKIKKLLDAGNAIYLGVDPRDCARVLRNSFVRKNTSTPADRKDEDVGEKKKKEEEEELSPPKQNGWIQRGLSGNMLDPVAKIVLLLGLYLSGHMLFAGLETFVSRVNAHGRITFLVAILQVIWGFFFGATCVFGMSIMWSKLRRSPAAALIFLVLWVFTTCLVVVVGSLWLYFYYAVRNHRIEKCHSQTVRAGSGFFDPNAPRRSAPKEQVDICVAMAKRGGMQLMLYGVSHILTAMSSLFVIVWARAYRGRLLAIEDFERQLEEEECTEKVGLVIGTSPLGISKPKRLEPTLEEEEERLSPLGVLLQQRDGETMVVGDRRRTLTISMGSGILPVSARHSDIYPEDEKPKSRQPSPLAPRPSPKPSPSLPSGPSPRSSPSLNSRPSPRSSPSLASRPSPRSSPALTPRSNRIL